MAKNEKAGSISIQKMVILATIISALVGGISGNLTTRRQNKALISMKKDEIAHSLTEAYLKQLERLGITSDYPPISHWAVHRRILENYDASKEATSEEIRDMTETAMQACNSDRAKISMLIIARSDFMQLKNLIRIAHDEIEKGNADIDNIPNTPEGNKDKEKLRKNILYKTQYLEQLEALLNKTNL